MLSWQKSMNAPSAQKADLPDSYPILLTFRKLTWICLFVLFVTGLYNLFVRGYNWYDLVGAEFWQGYLGETLMVKLLLFL